MKKSFFFFCLLYVCAAVFTPAQAQTYVWKNGHPLVTDPDSITFVQPETGAQITSSDSTDTYNEIHFLYPTQDYIGLPI